MNVTDSQRNYYKDTCATLTLSDNVQALSENVQTFDDNDNDNERRREDVTLWTHSRQLTTETMEINATMKKRKSLASGATLLRATSLIALHLSKGRHNIIGLVAKGCLRRQLIKK